MTWERSRWRWVALAALLVALGGVLWFLGFSSAPRGLQPGSRALPSSPSTTTPVEATAALTTPLERLHLAAQHGDPSASPEADVRLVQEVLETWLTNFGRDGLPVGDNREITAALCGENRLRVAFIDREHPSLNTLGEWCDRWQTPYRFHALSSTRLEVVSAGPDRRFGTADDVGTFTPAP